MRGIEGVPDADRPRLTNVVSRAHGLGVELPRELARSRRHSHEFSLILLRAPTSELPGTTPPLTRAIDRLALRIRLSDLLVHLDEHRLLIACPETDAAGAQVLLRDLVGLIAAEGIRVRASAATFPTSALTAAELLRACEVAQDVDVSVVVEEAQASLRDDVLRIVTHEGGRR
ncbi:hypothetical protein BH23ACT10_BH23ACT10_36560 [soil metagenome]